MKNTLSKILISLCALVCLLVAIDPALALIMGAAIALFGLNPDSDKCAKAAKKLLPLCVIGLGAGMNLTAVLQAGASGFAYTAISIAAIIALGMFLARTLKVGRTNAALITIGTAICGGSAIAALAPVIHARGAAIAISLAVVFALNALALLIFPPLGDALHLSQHQFGLWAALAIHDTSSVVGAGLKYGSEALQTATSVKLARALWIVPLVLLAAKFWPKVDDEEALRMRFPFFILGFIALSALVTYVPQTQEIGAWAAFAAKRGLVLTLFLIGAGLNAKALKDVGIKPLLFGLILWICTSVGTLAAIKFGLVS